MKKLFAILMSVIMIVAFMPTMAFAADAQTFIANKTDAERDWNSVGKFRVELKTPEYSDGNIQLEDATAYAEVYEDYSVYAHLNNGSVNGHSVQATVAMRNVESLGCAGQTKTHSVGPFEANMNRPFELKEYFPNIMNFKKAKIAGSVNENAFSYEISDFALKKGTTNERVLTATPDSTENVRAAWKELTNQVTTTSYDSDDSKIVIPEGAYLQIGTQKLTFDKPYTINPSENGVGNLEGGIRTAASLDENAAALKDGATVALYVPKDSVLRVGQSEAKLNHALLITSNVEITKMTVNLKELKESEQLGLVKNLFTFVDNAFGCFSGTTDKRIDVLSEYVVKYGNQEAKVFHGKTFVLPAAASGHKWVDKSNQEIKAGEIKVTSDMELKQVEAGGSTGGGGGGPAVVPPATDNVTNNAADKNTTADLTPAVKDNKAETTVDAKTADKIVEKALENKSEEIIVDAAGNNTVASSEVGIPEKTVKEIAEKTDANLVIKTDNGKVDLDKAAVKAVADQAGTTGTVKLIVETVKTDADICHVNLKLVTSNGAVTDFKGGNVKVTINLTKELAAKELVCVYIDDNGIYTLVEGVLNADGTYTFTTGHFSEYAVMAKAEADKKIAEQLNTLIKEVNLKVRTSKTAKKNIKAVVSGDVKAITDAGYTVKYKFYRSEKKASKYVAKATKAGKTYVNTAGKKGTKYYYKAKALVYDGDKLVGQTVLKQCKYGARTWSK